MFLYKLEFGIEEKRLIIYNLKKIYTKMFGNICVYVALADGHHLIEDKIANWF